MDSWNERQIQMMKAGGNEKCINFLAQYNVPKSMAIAMKYNTPAALLYRDRITATVDGRPLPTELPKAASSSSAINCSSDPLPGESETEYVARQRQLQEEAKERMRQKFGGSSGLSSKGKMGGIGSDPNYRPGSSNIDASEVTAKIAENAKNAFGFVSNLVAKATVNNNNNNSNNNNNNNNNNSSDRNFDSQDEQQREIDRINLQENVQKGWSVLTTNAVELWKKAAVATSEIVKDLTKPESEDDFRFPRASLDTNPQQQSSSLNRSIGSKESLPSSKDSSSSRGSSGNDGYDGGSSSISTPFGSNNFLDDNLSSNFNSSMKVSRNDHNDSEQQSFQRSGSQKNYDSNATLSVSSKLPNSSSSHGTSSSSSSIESLNNLNNPPIANKKPEARKPPQPPTGDDFFSSFGV